MSVTTPVLSTTPTTKRNVRPAWPVLASVLLLAAAGCEDPAKGKPQATVSTATSSLSAPAAGVTYAFTQANSKIAFVGAKVTRKHDGSFGTFQGTVALVGGDPTKSTVSAEIDAASIDTDTPKLTGHLKSADFFDVEKFPKVTFQSTSITPAGKAGATHTITGNLSLHGVTKAITFPAKIDTAGGGVNVGAEFSINRKDFGIAYPGMADDLIRDDVVLKLDIHAARGQS
jgi:polyisoprenoid-binding protein YceI